MNDTVHLSDETIARLGDLTHPPQQRLSISIGADLAAWTRAAAKQAGVPVSAIVQYAIREHRAR